MIPSVIEEFACMGMSSEERSFRDLVRKAVIVGQIVLLPVIGIGAVMALPFMTWGNRQTPIQVRCELQD